MDGKQQENLFTGLNARGHIFANFAPKTTVINWLLQSLSQSKSTNNTYQHKPKLPHT